jgi:ankyrin repeat protein
MHMVTEFDFITIAKRHLQLERNQKMKSAAHAGNYGVMKAQLIDGADMHFKDDIALRYSVRAGNLEMVQFLLIIGANVQANNGEPLDQAIKRGHYQIVRALVEAGATVPDLDLLGSLDAPAYKMIRKWITDKTG